MLSFLWRLKVKKITWEGKQDLTGLVLESCSWFAKVYQVKLRCLVHLLNLLDNTRFTNLVQALVNKKKI